MLILFILDYERSEEACGFKMMFIFIYFLQFEQIFNQKESSNFYELQLIFYQFLLRRYLKHVIFLYSIFYSNLLTRKYILNDLIVFIIDEFQF
jgi:hypothetical protein